MRALYFSPPTRARIYKEGSETRNPSHWGNALLCYLSPPLLTPCTATTSPRLSSQDATGAPMATRWDIALAVAMAAPTPQWDMVLAMATMAVGLSATGDTGHLLSTDWLKSPRPRIFSPLKAEQQISRFPHIHSFSPHLLINLRDTAFQLTSSPREGKWKRRRCLKLPALADVLWDVFGNLTSYLSHTTFEIFMTLMTCHDEVMAMSIKISINLSQLVSYSHARVKFPFLVCGIFSVTLGVVGGSEFLFLMWALGTVRKQRIIDPVWLAGKRVGCRKRIKRLPVWTFLKFYDAHLQPNGAPFIAQGALLISLLLLLREKTQHRRNFFSHFHVSPNGTHRVPFPRV